MITHVAIRFRDQLWSLPKPYRHHDVIRMIFETTGVDRVEALGDDQGFLDEVSDWSWRYLTRGRAFIVAHANNQLVNQERSSSATKLGELYSEDLW